MVSVKVGLTGGIGSGKSFVANLLKQRGIKVFDCDSMAKKLMTEDAELVRKIREIVGDEAYFFGTDGSLRLNKALWLHSFSRMKRMQKLSIMWFIHRLPGFLRAGVKKMMIRSW